MDKWSVWGEWSTCSSSCGNGTRTRAKDCYTAGHFLVDPGNCYGEQKETTACLEMKCPGRNQVANNCVLSKASTFAGNILFVFGGYDQGGGAVGSNDAYALSLKEEIPVPSCLEEIPNFPLGIWSPVAHVFEDGLPASCGGFESMTC